MINGNVKVSPHTLPKACYITIAIAKDQVTQEITKVNKRITQLDQDITQLLRRSLNYSEDHSTKPKQHFLLSQVYINPGCNYRGCCIAV